MRATRVTPRLRLTRSPTNSAGSARRREETAVSTVPTQTPWTTVASTVQPSHRFAVTPDVALTVRESQILALISQGYSNQEIADELFLSINSIKSHIRSAYRRIGVERRTQAVVWAITHGSLAWDDARA